LEFLIKSYLDHNFKFLRFLVHSGVYGTLHHKGGANICFPNANGGVLFFRVNYLVDNFFKKC